MDAWSCSLVQVSFGLISDGTEWARNVSAAPSRSCPYHHHYPIGARALPSSRVRKIIPIRSAGPRTVTHLQRHQSLHGPPGHWPAHPRTRRPSLAGNSDAARAPRAARHRAVNTQDMTRTPGGPDRVCHVTRWPLMTAHEPGHGSFPSAFKREPVPRAEPALFITPAPVNFPAAALSLPSAHGSFPLATACTAIP